MTRDTAWARGATAVVVMDAARPVGIITRLDLLEFMAHAGSSR